MSSVPPADFNTILQWANNPAAQRNQGPDMKILYIVGGIVAVLLLIWFIVMLIPRKERPVTLGDMSNPNNMVPPAGAPGGPPMLPEIPRMVPAIPLVPAVMVPASVNQQVGLRAS